MVMLYELQHYGARQSDTDHFTRLIQSGGGSVVMAGESRWDNYTQILFVGSDALVARLRETGNIEVREIPYNGLENGEVT